jgi:hypothetical protein
LDPARLHEGRHRVVQLGLEFAGDGVDYGSLYQKPRTGYLEKLDKLAALAGVRDYPTRIKCATLCWHTLHSALEGKDEPVTTE